MPEPSARAGGPYFGEEPFGRRNLGSTLKGSRTSREDPFRAYARDGGLDAEHPEAQARKGKDMGGEPGARIGFYALSAATL